MNRRTTLKWLSGIFAAACAAIVAIPAAICAIAAVRRRTPGDAVVQRLAKLNDIAVGRPVRMAVKGRRRDAWVLYPEETIGHVWVVRRTDESVPAATSRVDVYTAVCPHLGCSIQLAPSGQSFLCPCHEAAFELSGQAMSQQQLGYENPSPRDMDVLDHRLVQDEDTGDWWVEVKYERFEYGLTEKVAAT